MEKIKRSNGLDTKQKLLLAGMKELNTYGIHEFSTRRVARECGVSCAAPYKHFDNTDAFIMEILIYMNSLYRERQKKVIEKYRNADTKTQLIQVALDYILFLVENPEFYNILMQNFSNTKKEYQNMRTKFTAQIYRIAAKYCTEAHITRAVKKRKTFVIRSIIYGAAQFFNNKELEFNHENMKIVENMLIREFDLP